MKNIIVGSEKPVLSHLQSFLSNLIPLFQLIRIILVSYNKNFNCTVHKLLWLLLWQGLAKSLLADLAIATMLEKQKGMRYWEIKKYIVR